jgi:hypothetical protein
MAPTSVIGNAEVFLEIRGSNQPVLWLHDVDMCMHIHIYIYMYMYGCVYEMAALPFIHTATMEHETSQLLLHV